MRFIFFTMNKNLFILSLVLSFFTLIAKAQKPIIEVNYSYTTKFNGIGSEYQIDSKLISNGTESLYEMDHTNSFGYKNPEHKVSKNETVFGVKSTSNTFVYKNITENNIFYSNNIQFTDFYIFSPLDKDMVWNLEEGNKEILGYKCSKATISYGDRKYEAYYTTELGVSNGPWRFHGLPGLILEIRSLDDIFELKATSLKTYKSNKKIKNPYEFKRLMTWEDFLILYRKKYDDVIRNNMTEYGPSTSLPEMGIVRYIYH